MVWYWYHASCEGWIWFSGTFKVMSQLWTQLFLMLGNYNEQHLPIAFGWLPNKSFCSYFIFLLMLLRGYQKLRPEILSFLPRANLKMKVIKADYEQGIHQAFKPLFRVKVWLDLDLSIFNHLFRAVFSTSASAFGDLSQKMAWLGPITMTSSSASLSDQFVV